MHDVGWESVAESVWLDARYGARGLVRAPGFTTTVILTLSLAIGVTTAIFSLLDAILLKPLPVRDPDRLVLVGGPQYPVFEAFRQRTDIFVDLLATSGVTPLDVDAGDGRRERTAVSLVSGFVLFDARCRGRARTDVHARRGPHPGCPSDRGRELRLLAAAPGRRHECSRPRGSGQWHARHDRRRGTSRLLRRGSGHVAGSMDATDDVGNGGARPQPAAECRHWLAPFDRPGAGRRRHVGGPPRAHGALQAGPHRNLRPEPVRRRAPRYRQRHDLLPARGQGSVRAARAIRQAAAAAHGRGHPRALDRVRQHRQPAARPVGIAAPGDRHAAGARDDACPPRSSAVHREPAACRRRRSDGRSRRLARS